MLAHRVRGAGSRIDWADVETLTRLGVRLNHFAHAANATHRVAEVGELACLLSELRAVVARIAARAGA